MTEVDKIYPQFYSLLKEAFPNLTESEYQYCYLHIFGFDANDEAKLLGINPASVRMKRTRIYQEVQLKHNKETIFTRLHHQKPLKIIVLIQILLSVNYKTLHIHHCI